MSSAGNLQKLNKEQRFHAMNEQRKI